MNSFCLILMYLNYMYLNFYIQNIIKNTSWFFIFDFCGILWFTNLCKIHKANHCFMNIEWSCKQKGEWGKSRNKIK